MSNHQKEAGIVEFVGPLLKRLKLVKEHVPENSRMEKFIDQISTEVEKTKDILDCREKLDRELVGYFGKIERQIEPWFDRKPHEKISDLPRKTTIPEVGESSNTNYLMDKDVYKVQEFMDLLESLDQLDRFCLNSLSMFPANTELKKRLVIYSWFGLFVWEGSPWEQWSTKYVEELFSKLIDKNVFIPVHREHNKAIDSFTIEPIFHKWLFSNRRRHLPISSHKREEGTWCLYGNSTGRRRMLLNVDQRYLNSKDIMDMSSEHDRLKVVQLGSWRYTQTEVHNKVEETGSEETKSKDHIEVDQTYFLKKLGKNVTYLCLRGISGITEIHESIGKLSYLTILDLRACHNLEKLPEKPRSTLIEKILRCAFSEESRWFERLMVLDISECYLLDHMPEWVCELSCLEVLKGFVVGSLGNKKQSCQLGDLSKLCRLWKLSIRIVIDILDPEVFWGFDSLDNLLVLTITWGENKYKEIPTYSLPKYLTKLDIRCYPEANASKLQNPEELINLKRLYIRGGNLTKIPCHDSWDVEILRLRFLKKLVYPTEWDEVRSSFKKLKYVEYVGCPKPNNFPNKDGSSWRNEDRVLDD